MKTYWILCTLFFVCPAVWGGDDAIGAGDLLPLYRVADSYRQIVDSHIPILPSRFLLNPTETRHIQQRSLLDRNLSHLYNMIPHENGMSCFEAEPQLGSYVVQYNAPEKDVFGFYSKTHDMRHAYHWFLNKYPTLKRSEWTLPDLAARVELFGRTESNPPFWIPKAMLLSGIVLDDLISARSEEEIDQVLFNAKDHLNFTQKIDLASFMGDYFLKRYNNDRKYGRDSFKNKVVTLPELLESVRSNTPGGLCGDAALGGAQILHKLGIPEVYIIAYNTAKTAHTSLLVQDPDDATRTYSIDYHEVNVVPQTEGPRSITQPKGKDIGIQYGIFDYDGKPVAQIPTQFGQILEDVTGGSSQDPFLKENASLSKVEVLIPSFQHPERHFEGQAFSGRTTHGDSIEGISVQKVLYDRHKLSAKLAVALAQFERRGENPEHPLIAQKRTKTDRNVYTIRGDDLYALLQIAARTPEMRFGNFSMQGHGALDLAANQIYIDKEEGDVEENITVEVGVSSSWHSPDEKTKALLNLKSNFYYTETQVASPRDNDITLKHNYTVLNNEISQELAPSLDAIVDMTAALRNYGQNISFQTGLRSPKYQIKIGMEKPIQKDMPRFFPGSVPKCRAQLSADVCEAIFILEYEKNLDTGGHQTTVNMKKSF